MPPPLMTPEELFAHFDALGIAHRTYSHPPVFTVAELAARLTAPRFSFGGADDLHRLMGVRPGRVTPFALLNDVRHLITPVLDAAMLEYEPLNYHPLENDRTTAISAADLRRLIAASGHVPRIVDLADLERAPDIPES